MAMGTMCRQGARLAMQQRAMPPALVRRAGRDSHLPGFVDCLASLEPKALYWRWPEYGRCMIGRQYNRGQETWLRVIRPQA